MCKTPFIFFVMFFACNTTFTKNRNEIIRLVNSKDVTSQIKGIFMIGETRDSTLVKYLLKDMNDPRVTHHINFKGMSIYQQKIGAMRKITNARPSVPITSKPDSTVIFFYLDIARKRGWLSDDYLK